MTFNQLGRSDRTIMNVFGLSLLRLLAPGSNPSKQLVFGQFLANSNNLVQGLGLSMALHLNFQIGPMGQIQMLIYPYMMMAPKKPSSAPVSPEH